MLNKPVDDIIMENGKVVGVKSEGEVSLLCGARMAVWVGLGLLLRGTLPGDSASAGSLRGSPWAADQGSRRSPPSHFCW